MPDSDSNTNSDGSLTIMGHRIPPQHVKSIVKFYEADHVLTPGERAILADELSTTQVLLVYTGMLTSTMALFGPSVNKYFKDKAAAKKAGAHFVKRPVFHKPFLSGSLAAGVYFLTIFATIKTTRDQKVSTLIQEKTSYKFNEEERASKGRLLNVWNALDLAKVPLFAMYYRDTAEHPANILKDPRSLATTKPHEVTYMPPSRNNSVQAKLPSSSWLHVREQNGYIDQKATIDDKKEIDLNSFISNEDSSNSKDSATDQSGSYSDDLLENTEDTQKLSAWERVRRGK